MEAWKFMTLFLVIWVPLWAWFETLTDDDND